MSPFRDVSFFWVSLSLPQMQGSQISICQQFSHLLSAYSKLWHISLPPFHHFYFYPPFLNILHAVEELVNICLLQYEEFGDLVLYSKACFQMFQMFSLFSCFSALLLSWSDSEHVSLPSRGPGTSPSLLLCGSTSLANGVM